MATLLLIVLLAGLWVVVCVVVVGLARSAARGDADLQERQAGLIDEAPKEEVAGGPGPSEPND